MITPLIIMGLGYGPTEFLEFRKDILNWLVNLENFKNDYDGLVNSLFELFTINYFYLGLAFILSLLIYSLSVNCFYIISDDEIRHSKSNFLSALRQSFNSTLLTILGFIVLLFFIQIAVMIISMLLFSMFNNISIALGIVIGFVGFLFVIVFFLRFTVGFAAIVHGKMKVTQAISYSLSHINWKRGWMLLLLGIVFNVVAALISSLLMLAIPQPKTAEELSYANLLLSKASSIIVNGFVYAFAVSATSTLYFRYSDDSSDDDGEDLQNHLVE
ncbi:MAG: hypothetical protein IT245_04900 [Bacteroidia bacterium]|nr:hypothetical protein [Bacteroidia bacterium]